MVHTTREGKVRTEVGEIDVDLGSVEKDEQVGWESSCAFCDEKQVAPTKSAAVDLLEDHFVKTHITPDI